MKRVLLVSAVFPPQLGGTSEKMARRAKYFSRFGWQTVVLVPSIPPGVEVDETLLNGIGNAEIHRTGYLFRKHWPSLRHDKERILDVHRGRLHRLLDLFFVFKGYVRWLPYALLLGRRLAASVDVILTMNNPVTLHLVGFVLQKLAGKLWVAEIRDPIVEYAYGRRGPEKLNYWLERMVVHSADVIVQRGDGTPDIISQRYPLLPSSKFIVIPYAGFDPDDFAVPTTAEAKNGSNTLVISYTGSFYGDTITPIPFLRGCKQFLSGRSLTPQDFHVIFAGDWDDRYDRLIDDLGLQDYVEYVGYVTRQKCLDLWQESQVLLLILGKEQDNFMRIPSKFWDYLGAGRSILALVHPEGKLARIVREQQLGFVAGTENDVAIAAALEQVWQAYRSNALRPQPSAEFLAQATRESSERAVVDVLNQLVT